MPQDLKKRMAVYRTFRAMPYMDISDLTKKRDEDRAKRAEKQAEAGCTFVRQGPWLFCHKHKMLIENGFQVIDGVTTSVRHVVT